jgi:TetR/AcrR family transcriptional repressor of nem operon
MAHDTKDRIVAAAARLFLERGFDGTSVASVLAASGVNSGSLYHFFDSKEDVAVAVMEQAVARLVDRLLDPAEASNADPLRRLHGLLRLQLAALEGEGGGEGAVVALLAAEVGERSERIRTAGARYHHVLAERVQRWLDEAGPRLPSFLDRSGMADFVATVMAGGVARSLGAGAPNPMVTAVDQGEQYLVLLEDAARRERLGETPPTVEARGRGAAAERPGDWRSW